MAIQTDGFAIQKQELDTGRPPIVVLLAPALVDSEYELKMIHPCRGSRGFVEGWFDDPTSRTRGSMRKLISNRSSQGPPPSPPMDPNLLSLSGRIGTKSCVDLPLVSAAFTYHSPPNESTTGTTHRLQAGWNGFLETLLQWGNAPTNPMGTQKGDFWLDKVGLTMNLGQTHLIQPAWDWCRRANALGFPFSQLAQGCG
jgi:hypothetical protein